MSLKAILFDLDGTLTDSGPGIMHCLELALTEMGEPVPPKEILRLFVGPPLTEAFAEHCGMDLPRAEEAIRVYRKHYSAGGLFENTVYPGIPELLETLCGFGLPLYLATSKPEHYARAIMEHFDLAKYFTYIGGALTDGKRREKAEVIAYVLETTGIPADECVMIGDRKYDVEGAASFGIPTLGVTWGYGSKEELLTAGASWIADSTGETAETIRTLMEEKGQKS
ncbi:MAG: HAD-IA family hydrolase [Clostridia bacterium]|nr:HAD-IA family hydrolase [Clostridia bacterium]